MSDMTALQRVKSGNRRNWRVGQLIAFVHGPGRKNIYRFRVVELTEDGKRPLRSHPATESPWTRRTNPND